MIPPASNGSAAVPSPLESSSGFDRCSMKASPGAVPFGPMSVEVVETTDSIVVTVVSVVSTS